MSIKKKLFVSTIATIVVAGSMSIGAYAATNWKLFINGKEAKSEIIIKNGTTYVPLRLVSESLGAKVSLQGKNIYVDMGKPVEGTTQPSTNSRSNPAAIGSSLSYKKKDVFGEYDGKLSIVEVIRGSEANQMIADANMFNEEPKEGYEYMLVKAKISVVNSKEDSAISLSPSDYTLISSAGVEYERVVVVTPDPDYRTSIYKGAEHTGWFAFEVKKDDANPLIVYDRSFNGAGGLWFKTTK